MKSFAEQQNEFFVAAGSPTVETHGIDFCCNLANSLIVEEVELETLPALRKYQTNPSLENLTVLADGLVDSIYVLCHAANSLGIPLDAVWDEVHRSNMAKIDPSTGRVQTREDGKILKPSGWTPPNIFEILMEHQTRKQMGDHYMNKGMVK